MTPISIPLKTGAGLNDREHWRVKANRALREKRAIGWGLVGRRKPTIPCTCLITRVAPSNGLDTDNLAGSMKATRDAIAAWLGIDDRHANLVNYTYAQRRGKWGVEIEFQPVVTP
jgi:hypothetical protein